MLNFFLAVGFPKALAERAADDYGREFAKRYRPLAFSGVHDMLKSLRDSGLRIGLVTSNLCANIKPALGDAMQYFEPSCVFLLERFSGAADGESVFSYERRTFVTD
jgi:phosphoglycolate phosphatase-like HAD superfamily hydrolase